MFTNLNLGPGELSAYDFGAEAPQVLPDNARSLCASFADLLQLRAEPIPGSASTSGESLPATGNTLPQSAAALPASLGSDPEAIVSSLNRRVSELLDAVAPTEWADQTRAPAVADAAIAPVDVPPGEVVTPIEELVDAPAPPILPDGTEPVSNPPLNVAPVITERSPTRQESHPRGPVTPVIRNHAGMSDVIAVRGEGRVTDGPNRLPPEVAPKGAATPETESRELPVDLLRQTKRIAVEGEPARPQANGPQPGQNSTNIVEPVASTIQLARVAPDASVVPRTAPAPVVLPPPIDVPVQQLGWGDAVSERVILMATNQQQNAEIRLSPAELGPLRVHLSVDDGHATVTFQAQHATTREVLEQALPRLRDLLAENGMTLDSANVSDDAGLQGRRDEAPGAFGAGNAESHSEDGSEHLNEPAGPARRVAEGLVDTFA
ncbi:MAG: flagellar hook-length control protein FliK [Woeseiaceae bacterium]